MRLVERRLRSEGWDKYVRPGTELQTWQDLPEELPVYEGMVYEHIHDLGARDYLAQVLSSPPAELHDWLFPQVDTADARSAGALWYACQKSEGGAAPARAKAAVPARL